VIDAPARTRRAHYPLMDAMRAISVVSVVATHTTFFTTLRGSHTTQVRFGYISVTIFFVVSAFLLWQPWVDARLNDVRPPSTRVYAWRRVLRIVPGYYVALTVIAICLGLTYVFTPQGVVTLYGFAQVYRPEWALRGIVQAWTLGVEVAFYAFLPIWGWLMGRLRPTSRGAQLRRELLFCLGLFVISLVYKVIVVRTDAINGGYGATFQLNLLNFLDDFAIGMALATVAAAYRDRHDQPRALRALDRYPSIAWAVTGVTLAFGIPYLGLLGQVGDATGSGTEYVVRHYLIEVIAASLVLPAMFGNPARGLVRRLLRNRVLLYLGMISYGIYLWHFAVLLQLDRWGFGSAVGDTTVLWFGAAIAISVLLATLSFYLVERPFLRLKRLVKPRPQPATDDAIAEPAPVTPASR
jgi:peptidoglycan/LPS O-acetylase OafA/YrhL